jgi:hypothetical protein
MNNKDYKIMSHSQFGIGTHEGLITKRTKNGGLQAHTLVCFDADVNEVKTCGEADTPWGIVTRDALTKGALACIQPLSGCAQTAKLKLSGVAKAGKFLCRAAEGCVRQLPEEAGVYQIIGMALTDGLNNDYVEAITTLPYNMEVK